MSVSFTVPLMPPSVNHYYEGSGRHRRVSPAGKAFKAAVAIFARGATVIPDVSPTKLRKVAYSVRIKIVLGKTVKGDGDNCWKGIMDGLKDAGVIHSDDRVLHHEAWKDPDSRPDESRTEILVEVIGA